MIKENEENNAELDDNEYETSLEVVEALLQTRVVAHHLLMVTTFIIELSK